MTHFSDSQLWYSPSMEPQHHKSFPFFYSLPNHNQNHNNNHCDEDSDNSSSNNTPNFAATNTKDNRSETASSLSGAAGEREHMFEKPLTPSDVGKLNRLVIPKQYAEKYFPLAGVSDKTSAGAGAVLLGFEDEAGKCWRFRYSYWNSSQSYVLTKGWSRYVKEKKLDAGDVVFFERHRFEPDRFFIGSWRRMAAAGAQPPARAVGEEGWAGSGQRRSFYNRVQQQMQGCPASHQIADHRYQPDLFRAETEIIRQHTQTQKAPKSGKRFKLFGVNLECKDEEEEEVDPDPGPEPQASGGSSLSSQGPGQGSAPGYVGLTAYNYNFDDIGNPANSHHHNQYMGINFSQDLNQMRNRFE